MATGSFILFNVTGDEQLVKNVQAIEEFVLTEAEVAVEEGAGKTVAMMQRLVPVRTGKLKKSIRFSWGKGGGAPRTTGRAGSRAAGKTRIVGYIIAGDETTLVGGHPRPRKGRKATAAKQFQNARLQEFGTVKMKAQPFFYPAWRATRKDIKATVAKIIAQALKRARTLDQGAQAKAA